MFVIDIDNLKVTNDTFGHEVGDFLINAIATRVSASMAPDITFRTGGDEFTVIIQSHNALYDLDQTAEVIFKALSSPVEFDGQTILPRVTIGGAVLQHRTHNLRSYVAMQILPSTMRRKIRAAALCGISLMSTRASSIDATRYEKCVKRWMKSASLRITSL